MHLIVTMAGNATRFANAGEILPKPMIIYEGYPFFWWAVESIRRVQLLSSITFVIQDKHAKLFSIDKKILAFYTNAIVIKLATTTSGAAETAMLGIKNISDQTPIGFLDCDLAFDIASFSQTLNKLRVGSDGALCVFKSINPSYSYVELDSEGRVVGTAEKNIISAFAIAGFYLFRSAAVFNRLYANYKNICPYTELFMSGLYNLMIEHGSNVELIELSTHISLGTPQELEKAKLSRILPQWYKKSR